MASPFKRWAVVFLLAALCSCHAFVDLYKWKFKAFQNETREANAQFPTDLTQQFLALYTGDVAEDCKAKLGDGYPLYAIFQARLIGFNGKAENIDNTTYNKVMACHGDQTCMYDAYNQGSLQLKSLICQTTLSFYQTLVPIALENAEYLNKCIANESCYCEDK